MASGYYDIYTKGGIIRRLFIPKKLWEDVMAWLNFENRSTGYLFLNRFVEKITPRGIYHQLKPYAKKYGLNEKVIYPYSARLHLTFEKGPRYSI